MEAGEPYCLWRSDDDSEPMSRAPVATTAVKTVTMKYRLLLFLLDLVLTDVLNHNLLWTVVQFHCVSRWGGCIDDTILVSFEHNRNVHTVTQHRSAVATY